MSEARRGDAFVGRDTELAALSRALDQAAAGDVAVALVAGEPGIGKSRLVDALAADARGRGIRVLWAEARDEQHAPLRLWAPVERALGATAPGAGLGTGTRAATPPDLPASERRWELLDALVAGLADAAPVAVLLEDLHWADEASVWVLERLPRRLAGHGVLLVGTTRRDEPGAVPLTDVRRRADAVVELAGLDVAAVGHLIDALAVAVPAADVEATAADLVERTGGNPLFLRELLAMGDRGVRGDQGDRLPPAVSDVLTRSLARLDAPVGEALATLAVAGPATPVAVLTAALSSTVDEVMERFETAAAADVIRLGPAGRPTFRHVLLSAAAVEAVTPTRRRRLHAALADAWAVLDASPAGRARSATHRLAALPHGDAAEAGRETQAALEALRRAGDAGAAAELATAADQALDAAGPTPDLATVRARIRVELARALTTLGDEGAATEAFARAADLALEDPDPDPELRAVAEAGASRRVNPFVAQPDRIRRLDETDAALPAGDHPLRVDLLARRGVLRVAVPGNLAAAHADGDEAVAMARRLGDPDLLVGALTDRHYVPAGVDGLVARAAAADEMVSLGERLRRPDVALQGYEWRFGDRLDRGRRNEATAALESLEAYGLVMPSPKWQWSALIRRSTVHALDGDRAGVLACADQVLAIGEDVAEDPEVLGMECAIRATAAQLWGFKDDLVEDLSDRFEALSRPLMALPFISLVTARAWCAFGREEQALPIVQRFAADPAPLFEILEGIAVVGRLGWMVAQLGLEEHAGRLRRALTPFADRLGTGAGIQLHTPVATTLGRLALLEGDAAAAVADHERAVAIAEAMPSPTLVALTSIYLAEARAASGDAAGAAAAAERARRAAPADMVLPDVGVGRLGVDPASLGASAVPGNGGSTTAAVPVAAGVPGDRRATLRRTDDGAAWRIEAPHGCATVPASRGLDQLALLLAAPPGHEVPATELAGMDAAPVPVARDLGAALDARAKREYRRRITELQDDIDEADAHHDPERAARARLELDALVQELRRAVGLDGRDRPTGSGAERARVNVTRSLKRAIATIADQLPTLGAHLDNAVRTGRTCTYSPEPSTTLTWIVTR